MFGCVFKGLGFDHCGIYNNQIHKTERKTKGVLIELMLLGVHTLSHVYMYVEGYIWVMSLACLA